ncbi:MAG TPA: response regulator [bacterium]|nr:response regulator [bacterium]
MITHMPRIMVVDDTPHNLRLLENLLVERGYRVFALPNGEMALRAAAKNPPDLVLLDVDMPGLNGYEVCQRFKADRKLAEVPIIFISALAETEDKVRAFEVGGVDYVTKPIKLDEVAARVATHLKIRALQANLEEHNRHLQDIVDAQVRKISESQMATIFALAKLAENRDTDTGEHLERVQEYCRVLGSGLQQSSHYAAMVSDEFISNICQASPLHDIGKVAIPDHVLLKPGKLNREEFEVMKAHTAIGAQTLMAVLARYPENDFVQMGIEIARSHHERWDGGGYPEGLAGTDIPLSARLMAVVDVYDAFRSDRCYRNGLSHEATRKIILEGRGTQFDPVITDKFLELEEAFREIFARTSRRQLALAESR